MEKRKERLWSRSSDYSIATRLCPIRLACIVFAMVGTFTIRHSLVTRRASGHLQLITRDYLALAPTAPSTPPCSGSSSP